MQNKLNASQLFQNDASMQVYDSAYSALTEMDKNVLAGRPPLWADEILTESTEEDDNMGQMDFGPIGDAEFNSELSWDTNERYYDILEEALQNIDDFGDLLNLWYDIKHRE